MILIFQQMDVKNHQLLLTSSQVVFPMKTLTSVLKFLLFTPPVFGVDESTESGSRSTVVDISIGTVSLSSVVRSTVGTPTSTGTGYLGPLNFTFPTRGLWVN